MKLLVTLIATVYSQGGRGGGRGRDKEREVPDEVTSKPDYLDDLSFGGLGTDYGFDSYGESSNYGDLYNFGDSYGSLFGDYADTYDADYDADTAAADAVDDFSSDAGFGDYDGPATTFAPFVAETDAATEAPAAAPAAGRPETAEADEEKGGRPNNNAFESGSDGTGGSVEFGKFLGAGDNYCNLCSGRDPADCMANRAIPGESSECPPNNFCGLEVRGHRGVMKHMSIRCMSLDECTDATRQNFVANVKGVMQCRPTEDEFLNGKFGQAYGESVCRNCVATCESSNHVSCYSPEVGSNDGGGLILPNALDRENWEADMTGYTNQ